MLAKFVKDGSSVSGANVFWWLTDAGPGYVGVEVCLWPFEGKGGYHILRKSRGKDG